jgi:hypothetical protein
VRIARRRCRLGLRRRARSDRAGLHPVGQEVSESGRDAEIWETGGEGAGTWRRRGDEVEKGREA